MPGKKHLRGVGAKEQREYEHIKESAERAGRYGLGNSLGVIVEDAIVVAILILGGILEACPGSRDSRA